MQQRFLLLHAGRLAHVIVGMLIVLSIPIMVTARIGSDDQAHAAGGAPSFALQPVVFDPSNPLTRSYFIFNSTPGTILRNQFRLTNRGKATGTAQLYGVDATTSQTSGTVYLLRTAKQQDVGTWLTVGGSQVTLAPGQSKLITFQVTIPHTVRSGQHVGAIVAENVVPASTTQNKGIHINIQTLTIMAVQVNLPGPQIETMTASRILAASINHYQILQLRLSNTGTVMFIASGSLKVSDAKGHLLQTIPLKLSTLLPVTTIDYPIYVRGKILGVGTYTGVVDLRYGHNHLLHYTTSFKIIAAQLAQIYQSQEPPKVATLAANTNSGSFPWWLPILGVLLVIIGILLWMLKRSHTRIEKQ